MISDNPVCYLFFIVSIGFFVGIMFTLTQFEDIIPACPKSVECIPASSATSGVMYLYPSRCIDCDKRIPPTCEGCVKYYSSSGVFESLSEDLGVQITPLISDAVNEPAVFVYSGGLARLGDAKNKVAMASSICAILETGESCAVVADELSDVKSCFIEYKISEGAVVYHTSKNCEVCHTTNGYVDELEGLKDDAGEPYIVYTVDEDDAEAVEVLKTCTSDLLNLNKVPQVFCPTNGRSFTGYMTLSGLRDFADDCIEAAAR